MTQVQVTRWRELPSLVVARDDEQTVKVPLPPRFQEAIDEAAMRAGALDADAYLAGWARDDWREAPSTPSEAAAAVAADLERRWPPEALTDYLERLG